MYEFQMKDLDGNWSRHSARELKVFHGQTVVFDTQSMQSTSSKAPAEPTAAPGDSAKVAKSESMESGGTTEQGQSSGEIARESMPWPPRMPEVYGLQSAPTSPPTTEADSPPMKPQPMTTPSADSSPLSISDITKSLQGAIAAMSMTLLRQITAVSVEWGKLRTYSESITRAREAPASDADKDT